LVPGARRLGKLRIGEDAADILDAARGVQHQYRLVGQLGGGLALSGRLRDFADELKARAAALEKEQADGGHLAT
jgi:hypothetical protein